MHAAEILVAVQRAGATLRVEGDSLVASNASQIAPEVKAAIRANKAQLIAALVGSGCKVGVVELPQAQLLQEGVRSPPAPTTCLCGRSPLAAMHPGWKRLPG
jgi:hypothetical protein